MASTTSPWALSRPSTGPRPSKVPLPPSQALASAHPSASTGLRAPGHLRPSITPREGGGREPQEAAASPSQVPIPVSIITVPPPLPSLVPPPPPPASSSAPYSRTTPRASAVPGPAIDPPRPAVIPEGDVIPSATPTTPTTGGSLRAHPHTPASAPVPALVVVPGVGGGGGGGSLVRTVYRDPEDRRRAQLQTAYGTLAPAERAGQDAWATRKADEFAPCPFNFSWERDGHYPGVS